MKPLQSKKEDRAKGSEAPPATPNTGETAARRSEISVKLSPEARAAAPGLAELEGNSRAFRAAQSADEGAAIEAHLSEGSRQGDAHVRRWTIALKRLGFTGKIDWPTLIAAWRCVGLPIEDFGRSDRRGLLELLEAKANVLDGIWAHGKPTSRRLLRVAGVEGGRPKGSTRSISIRGDLLQAHRDSKSLSLASFARWLHIKRSTYSRAEGKCLATEKTARKIASRLGLDPLDLLRH